MKTRKDKYKKGSIYSPDDIIDLPMDTNKYFDGNEHQFNIEGGRYEYGTVRCIQSFEITFKIKELPN